MISTFSLDSGSPYQHQQSVFSGQGGEEQSWMWDSSLSLISPKAILGEIIWLLICSLPKRVLNPLTLFSNSSRALLLILKNKLLLLKKPIKKPSYCKSRSSEFEIIFFAFSSNHYFKIEVMNLSYYFFLLSLLQYLPCTPGQLETSVRKGRYLYARKYETLKIYKKLLFYNDKNLSQKYLEHDQ